MSESTKAAAATLDQDALEAWGRRVGEGAAAGEIATPLVMALRGPLGAGKSVLARAVARGAGVTGAMPSPTYNLVFGYEGRGVAVRHLDLYRLEDPDEVWELGWQELGDGDQIALIEWPDRADALLPADRWEVELGFVADDGAGDDGAGPGPLRRVAVRRVGGAPAVVALPEGAS